MYKSCENTRYLIDKHLRKKNLHKQNASWKIGISEISGRGIFAKRDIEEGEIIWVDSPLIIGPRAKGGFCCVNCYKIKTLIPCGKLCGLPVCSKDCEDAGNHNKECALILKWRQGGSELDERLFKYLTLIRYLFLNTDENELVKCFESYERPQHRKHIESLATKMNFAISANESDLLIAAYAVLDINTFEVETPTNDKFTIKGLYPLSSMMNHNCVPNAMHVFDESQHMIVKAAMPIAAGQEICGSYTRVTWGTLGRHTHLLKTKHFSCRCSRCQDPTEFGTNLNAILCSKCQGLMLPASHSKLQWKCNTCDETMPASKIAFISNVLAGRTASIDQDVEEMLRFRREKLLSVLPDCNQVSLELKYRIIWILGFDHGYTFPELSLELLDTKEQFCRDVLDVVKRLGLGMCKIRGLVEYELYKCLRERYRRYPEIELENSMNELIEDAAKIFKYDLSAPKEVLEIWNKTDECCDWREAYFGDVKCI